MDESVLKSNHQYFLYLFKNDYHQVAIDELTDIINSTKKTLLEKVDSGTVYHMERDVNFCYGNPSFLQGHYVKSGSQSSAYRYDCYAGEIESGLDTFFFIAFPYKALLQEMRSSFEILSSSTFYRADIGNFIETVISSPDVITLREVRDKLKKREKINISSLLEIRKYSGRLLNDTKSDSMDIIGTNPVKSSLYEELIKLRKAGVIYFVPKSLNLVYWRNSIGEIDVHADTHSNFRFWLPGNYENFFQLFCSLVDSFNSIRCLDVYDPSISKPSN